MGRLFLLFTLLPLLELWLLIRVGGAIGPVPTLATLVAAGVLGAWLAKREGLRVVQGWQRAMSEGRLPEEGVLSGLLVLVGAVLLITPGVLSDVLGFALLFPPTRRMAAAVVRRWAERKIAAGQVRVVRWQGPAGGGGDGRWPEPPGRVIDVTPKREDAGGGRGEP